MKIIAFAASSSTQSINNKLVTQATELAKTKQDGVEVEIIDINDYEMPLFSLDREAELGTPGLAQAFYDKMSEADAIIISFAEHNASYTAAYKNLFDWVSRIDVKVYQNKPSVLLATSPGPGGAQNVLKTAVASAPFFGLDLKADLSIPSYFDNFDAEKGVLTNEDLLAQLDEAVSKLF